MWFIFSTPELIRHTWQLKTVVFLHWCLICTVLLFTYFKACRSIEIFRFVESDDSSAPAPVLISVGQTI